MIQLYGQMDSWMQDALRDLLECGLDDEIKSVGTYCAVRNSRKRVRSHEALVAVYMADVDENCSSASRLAFSHRRKDVHALKQAIRGAIRGALKNAQQPGQENNDQPAPETMYLTDTGYRAFASGERIVFTQNNRAMGVKNGMLGTVTHADERGLTVQLDTEDEQSRQVSINPHHYRSFDHGYAVTIHKSQGATVDRAYVLASKSMDHSLAYVAMTRHRDDMKLYLNAKDRPVWANHAAPDLSQVAEPEKPTPSYDEPERPNSPNGPSSQHHPTRKRPGPSR